MNLKPMSCEENTTKVFINLKLSLGIKSIVKKCSLKLKNILDSGEIFACK